MALTRKKKTYDNPFVDKNGNNSAFNRDTPMWLDDLVTGCIRVMTEDAPYTGNTRNETCTPSAVIRIYKNINDITKENIGNMLSISKRQVDRYTQVIELASPLIHFQMNRVKKVGKVKQIGLKNCYWLEKNKVDDKNKISL